MLLMTAELVGILSSFLRLLPPLPSALTLQPMISGVGVCFGLRYGDNADNQQGRVVKLR